MIIQKIAKQQSFYLLIISILAVSYFIDSANLDDIFTSGKIQHIEESDVLIGVGLNTSSGSFSLVESNSKSENIKVNTIYDEDSPSLEAEDIVYSATLIDIVEQSIISLNSKSSCEKLFLKNCSFLI